MQAVAGVTLVSRPSALACCGPLALPVTVVVSLWRAAAIMSPYLEVFLSPAGPMAEFRRSGPRLPLGNLRRRYIHASQNRRACYRLEQVVRPILQFIARLEVNHPTAAQLRNPKPLPGFLVFH